MMEESADLVFLCFVCFWREQTATMFALEENQFRFFRLRSSVFRREFVEVKLTRSNFHKNRVIFHVENRCRM